MIDSTEAASIIRRLSHLKNYPRSWENAEAAATEQDAAAESALIEAAASAPSFARLRQFVSDWERRRVEAPVPANLYEAWRGAEFARYRGTRRSQRCEACGDAGWVTRFYVADAIASRNAERIYIGEAEVEDWWQRIRATPTCAQRVYEEAFRCGCGGAGVEVQKDEAADADAYRQFSQSSMGELE